MFDFRVFLSAVTNELGSARDAVANDLATRDVQVRVQRSFRQEPNSATLLQKLSDYIADCNAVVCLVGARSGSYPPAIAAAPFASILPPQLAQERSALSYTQWEFLFARYYKRRLSMYLTTTNYEADEADSPPGDRRDLQLAFVNYVKSLGLDWTPVASRDQIRAEVLKESWPDRLTATSAQGDGGIGISDNQRLSWLSSQLHSDDPNKVTRAIDLLSKNKDPFLLQILKQLIMNSSEGVAIKAMEAARDLNMSESISVIACGLRSSMSKVRYFAVFYLGELAL